ncbi:MAG TPA: hypothetical protein VGN17_26095 [Bryobacteraceae bacterium]|jgi:hypothetical protein
MNSDAGKLLQAAIILQRATESFKVDWGDVSAVMAQALDVLKQEQQKHQGERIEATKQKPIDWARVKPLGK